MNKIIYLETDEEITSVVDKLRKIKTRDVVLVAPKRCTLVQSIVNLKLLKKQAKLLSKKIILVTPDPQGQNLALKAGIPTKKELAGAEIPPEAIKPKVEKPKFKERPEKLKEEVILPPKIEKIKRVSISDIVAKMEKEKVVPTKEELPKPRPKVKAPPRVVLLPTFNIKMFFVFLAGIVFVCFIVGLVILPTCTIIITPKTEPYIKDLEVVVAKDKEFNLENKIVSAEERSFDIESTSKAFKTTGEKEVLSKAKGKVQVYNNYSSETQILTSGSKLKSSSGLGYLTLTQIEIPGAKVEGGRMIPGQIEVEIEAENAGEEYNATSAKFTIPSLPSDMQKTIWAEGNVSGGESKKIKVVSKKDINDAQALLVSELYDKLKKELESKMTKGERFTDEATSKEVQILELSAKEGDEVSEFKMKIKVKIQTLVFEEQDIQRLIDQELRRSIPQEKYLIEDKEKEINFEVISFDPASSSIRLKVLIRETVAWKIDKKQIRKDLPGKTAEEAKEYLLADLHIKEVQVNLWPVWVKSVPYMEKKINIKEILPK